MNVVNTVPPTPATTMDACLAISIVEDVVTSTEEQQLEAWQWLHNSGIAYQLQGFYGRTCQQLIQQELITA